MVLAAAAEDTAAAAGLDKLEGRSGREEEGQPSTSM